MPVNSYVERAARIICRRAGAPREQGPVVADSFIVAHLALQLACHDLLRAAVRAAGA